MWWKLAVATLLAATFIIAIMLANMGVEIRVGLPISSAQASCRLIKFSIDLSEGHPALALDGAPTTETRFLGDLSKRRGVCRPQSTPIYVYADRRLKFGDFTRFDDELKQAGYKKIYLSQVGR